MTPKEHISLLHELSEISNQGLQKGVTDKNFTLILSNTQSIINMLLNISLIKWRESQDPTETLKESLSFLSHGINLLTSINSDLAKQYTPDHFVTIYASYLIKAEHSPVNLTILEEQPLIDGFFGNVLVGAANIAEWPRYRDALPKGKRYDLARRTNDLYAGLLAGTISAEEGVKQGEALWEEREDDTYYSTSMSGYGDGNQLVVDYKLGAILKKIGSTVPTVHAWRW